MLQVFESKPNEVTLNQLSNVVGVLIDWIRIVNSFYGKCTASKIPYLEIEGKMSLVVLNVKTASESNY